jgi:hypothetical protein
MRRSPRPDTHSTVRLARTLSGRVDSSPAWGTPAGGETLVCGRADQGHLRFSLLEMSDTSMRPRPANGDNRRSKSRTSSSADPKYGGNPVNFER